MTQRTLFERTDRRDAAAVATLLRTLTDDVERAAAFDFLAGADADAGVPTEMDVELELDRDDEAGETELEVELGWTDADERDAPATGGETGDTAAADEPAAAPHACDDAAPASQATFEVFRDNADEWRWRLRHRNGNVVADSGEGYTRRRGAENGLRSVKRNAPGADVDVED